MQAQEEGEGALCTRQTTLCLLPLVGVGVRRVDTMEVDGQSGTSGASSKGLTASQVRLGGTGVNLDSATVLEQAIMEGWERAGWRKAVQELVNNMERGWLASSRLGGW